MPLETIGSYALAGSSGAVARGARSVSSDFSNAAFAATIARGGNSGGDAIELPSPAPNVAAYLSPNIRLDLQTRLAIVEFRDSQSGRVEQQYPSPRAVREYQQNLPENSDLRTEDAPGEAQTELPELKVAGGSEAEDTAPLFGAGEERAPPAAPAPVAPSVASAATAAFGSHQNVLAGGRELAVA